LPIWTVLFGKLVGMSEASRKASRKHRAANLERRRESDREFRRRQREGDPERSREVSREANRRSYAAHAEARRERSRQWRADNPWMVLAQTHIKRAKSAGVVAEYVDLRVVFERDNWMCHDCGEPVDPELKGRQSKMASLDHIIPRSKGGSHTYENCATAHYGCNVARARRKER